jgi:polyisoprenoid-binding protein YceI
MAQPQELRSEHATQDLWTVDPAHSAIGFSVKHLMIATVRGRFKTFDARLHLDTAAPERARVEAEIEVASVDTGLADRDNHLRSNDFFLAAEYPKITFVSKRIERTGDKTARITGDLTIRGVTREAVLEAEHEGTIKDPWGRTRVAFRATTTIDRHDYGVAWNQLLEAGGVLVGDKVRIEVEAQFQRQEA